MRACRHQFGSSGKRLFFTLLIRTKRQVADNHRVFRTARDVFSVVTHIAQADGQRGFAPLHGHAQGIAHQQDIDAGVIHQRGKAGFIGGQHGDFFAFCLHLLQCVHSNH